MRWSMKKNEWVVFSFEFYLDALVNEEKRMFFLFRNAVRYYNIIHKNLFV